MRLLFILLLFSSLTSRAQFGAGMSATANFYNRFTNPNLPADTLYRSSGQVMGLLPGVQLQMMINIKDKVAFHFGAGADLKLFNTPIRIKPFQGLGSVSFMGDLHCYFVAARPKEINDALIIGIGGGYQLNRTELLYRPRDFKNYPRSFFHTIEGELFVGIGETYVSRGVFFRFGMGENKARHFQVGMRMNVNILRALAGVEREILEKKISEKEKGAEAPY